MTRKALALLVVVAMVGAVLGAVGLLLPHPVDADEHSATRSFVSTDVAAGSDLEVTITVRDFGNAASVVETLPQGFTYKSSSLPENRVKVDPANTRNITFAVVLEDSPYTFTYTVTAAGQAGAYDFSGTVATPLGRRSRPQDHRRRHPGGGHGTTPATLATPRTHGPQGDQDRNPGDGSLGR